MEAQIKQEDWWYMELKNLVTLVTLADSATWWTRRLQDIGNMRHRQCWHMKTSAMLAREDIGNSAAQHMKNLAAW
jgi:hypothetical protein